MSKLHFINRIDYTNAGDWMCSPLLAYYDYFSKYPYIRHDIDHVVFQLIQEDDLVIIGGSGMFNVSSSFNKTINKILDVCKNVIGWGIGFNECNYKYKYCETGELEEIHFEKFLELSIRDYKHPSGIEWVPCPSVVNLLKYNSNHVTKRDIGVIEHKAVKINIDGIDKITNSTEFDKIIQFILESDIILTNSYHSAYWSSVLGKRVVICNQYSSKFSYFKEPVYFWNKEGKIVESEIKDYVYNQNIDYLECHKDILKEHIEKSNDYFEKVKTIISNLDIDKCDSNFYAMSLLQSWNNQSQYVLRDEYENLHNCVFKRIDEVYYQLLNYINERK